MGMLEKLEKFNPNLSSKEGNEQETGKENFPNSPKKTALEFFARFLGFQDFSKAPVEFRVFSQRFHRIP